ncbi:MAG: hypothetical protein U0984_18710, partial [Prosthecobacter sp.]|nr:hypothetical protein [Prosthecobacter sp.]
MLFTDVAAVTGGAGFTIAVRTDGSIWGWGTASYSQLGTGNEIGNATAEHILGVSDIIAVSAGGRHATAVKSDGTAWAWGANDNGVLGAAILGSSVPIQVAALTNVTAIHAGGAHSVALKSDGSVYTWGLNTPGQWTPTAVAGATNVVSVAAGSSYSLALKNDHTVWAWGYSSSGQLGGGVMNASSAIPLQVSGLTSVVQISANIRHSLAIKSDGTAWSWGFNGYGQLGNNSTTNSALAIQVSGLTDVIAASAGGNHSMGLKSDGTVWTFGRNNLGQLGDGTNVTRTTAVQVGGLSGVVDVAAGDEFSLALKSDGTVWSWGNNSSGQLGDNATVASSYTPVQVVGLEGVTKIAAGRDFGMALKEDGTIASWGAMQAGQLGVGRASLVTAPTAILGINLNHGTPQVALTDPSGTVVLGQTKTLNFTTTLAGASIDEIQLRLGGVVVNTVTGSATSINWTPTTWGNFTVSLVARDVNGSYSLGSAEITLHVPYDSDSDGLPDYWELGYLGNLTSAAASDPDGDKVSNEDEYANGTNPNLAVDTDTDGIPDDWEVAHGLNPNVSDGHLDTDGDGLTNAQEYLLGTNPNDLVNPDSLTDTDGDGMPDVYETLVGLNNAADD